MRNGMGMDMDMGGGSGSCEFVRLCVCAFDHLP